MSKEYIEREVAISELECLPDQGELDYLGVFDCVRSVPAADVAPVVHAYWDTIESERFWICNMEESLKTGKPTKVKLPMCSHCKTDFGTIAFEFKHCPNCGARMDGGK